MGLDLRVVAKADRGIAIGVGLPKASIGSATSLRNRSILLVADDAARRFADTSALACAGAVVHVACNLRQADHAVRSNRFELLVTDLMLDDAINRDAHAKLAAFMPSLPNRTPAEKLVAAAEAMMKAGA
jgi:DNA-binding NtrC family response regulator